jgi:hypothetical protein
MKTIEESHPSIQIFFNPSEDCPEDCMIADKSGVGYVGVGDVQKHTIDKAVLKEKLEDLKNFVGNRRFVTDFKSLQEFYNIVEEIEKEMLK